MCESSSLLHCVFYEKIELTMPSSKKEILAKTADEQYNELLSEMAKTKAKWDEEENSDSDDDEQGKLLSQAIDLAIEQGQGWSPGEKEAYMEKILDDDFIPPMFATSQKEVEDSGLQDAFTSLIYDNETPTSLMLSFRKKGNDAFTDGKRNVAGNVQYFRDAINHYYEAFAWAEKIEPMEAGDLSQADTDDPTYTEKELSELKATIYGNIALAHMQLKNWGYVRDSCQKAVDFDAHNVKAWYRMARAHAQLQRWEDAGNAIDNGLACPGEEENKDLKKLQKQLDARIQKARKQRQQRERARAERVARVKAVWKHCKQTNIKLGRVPLVTSVTDDEQDDDEYAESRWHNHLPHSGKLPSAGTVESGWTWPCMFLYPSHNQSDFVEHFGENEMLAARMAQMFPEIEDSDETAIPWDYNNEFTCSSLAVYFEVHCSEDDKNKGVVHPEQVEILSDQASCMR